MDRAFERNGIKNISKGSIHIVRYADDMIILAQRNIETGINLLNNYLERLGLKLNEEKTRKLNLKEDKKVEFLGFQFHRVKSRKNNERLILVSPSPTSRKRAKEKIRQLINHTNPLKVKERIGNVNKFLTGWTNYFRLGHSSKVLNEICQYSNKRVRRLLQRNKGRSGYGWYKRS